MTGSQTANLVYALLFLVLVLSSLVSRRLPAHQWLRYALVWVAIFAAAILLYAYRSVAVEAWGRVRQELLPQSPTEHGRSIMLRMADDGHFHVAAQVNGHAVEFLVDSGATSTTMSEASARAAGVDIDRDGFGVAVDTANGPATMRRARIASLRLGSIVRKDLPILVAADEAGDVNLIGMNFLSSLQGWQVEGQALLLTP